MERLTWLEAAVFFHAVRADPSEAVTAGPSLEGLRLVGKPTAAHFSK